MKYAFLLLALFLTACSLKNYEHTESKVVIIKTPKLKFSDLAYVKHTDNAVALELFVAGKLVQKISINHLICVDDGCMSKSSFNSEYLNAEYPEEILQNIVLGLPIYSKRNYKKNSDKVNSEAREGSLGYGFTQSVQTQNVNINYSVNSQEIYFKDKKNRIIFKIKDINNGK